MRTSSSIPNSLSEDQASLWAARLDGGPLSSADQTALQTWLSENPKHRGLLSQYCQLSAELEKQLPALMSAGAIELPPAETSLPPREKRSLILMSGLAAAAAVMFVVWFFRPSSSLEKFSTAVGQRQLLTLSDGTRVELDGHSSLQMENRRSERRVRLAEGQAFFIVSKDKSRPFIVETPGGSVRVTGTTFDVRSETAQELDVIVVEGSVQVHPADLTGADSAPLRLGPGDHLSAETDGVSIKPLSENELQDSLAWRQGQIVFKGASLADALKRFAHYHGRRLIASPAAATLRVGGRFSLDDLDGFFAILEESFPIKVTRDLSGTIRLSLRDEP